MKRRSDCKARVYNDQMLCDYCGFAWDKNDADQPECQSAEAQRKRRAHELIVELRASLSLPRKSNR